MPDITSLLNFGAGALALRWIGRVLQVGLSVLILLWPGAARLVVLAVCWRYPRAKTSLISQLDEDLGSDSWLQRRTNVLDGLAGIVSQARDLHLAERRPETATVDEDSPPQRASRQAHGLPNKVFVSSIGHEAAHLALDLDSEYDIDLVVGLVSGAAAPAKPMLTFEDLSRLSDDNLDRVMLLDFKRPTQTLHSSAEVADED